MFTERNQALFRRVEAIAAGMGHRLRHTEVGGASDGNFTSALGIPTLVLRHSTERQEGLRAGVLRLAGTDRAGIVTAARELLLPDSGVYAAMHRPSGVFGDGQASRRIVRILEGWMKKA